MIREVITQIIIKADAGKVLTDGTSFVTTVVMPEGADIDNWREITEEQATEEEAKLNVLLEQTN